MIQNYFIILRIEKIVGKTFPKAGNIVQNQYFDTFNKKKRRIHLKV
jgi:hypothetical protein